MPITGKPKEYTLTAKAILEKISEYDIYRFYIPYPFTLGKTFSSPLRVDEKPSFNVKVSKDSGFVYHMDFVRPEHTGNSFQFVQQMFGLSYDEALKKIDQDFGLGLEPGVAVKDYKSLVAKYEQPTGIKLPPFITIVPRHYTSEELQYWNDYHIDISELKKYEIFAIKSLFVDGKRITNPQNRLRFAYRYEVAGKELWKIYTPLIKPECGYKWFTNVKIDIMEGLHNLNKSNKGIIVKSRKDLIIMSKFTPYVAACQNESSVSINQENIQFLKNHTKETYISFDSDKPGKKNSMFYTSTYSFKYLNTPNYLLPNIKDWADWARLEGLEPIKDFLIKKEIIK
jgi:hypothetical protein